MRTNQFGVSVTNKRTEQRIIKAYADANNFYEAWCAAYNETTLELQRIEEEQKSGGSLNWEAGDELDVCVSLYYTDLKAGDEHVFRINSESFNAVSMNPYEAMAKAFNRILDELQKQISLPSFGCKEHYIGFESRRIL